MRPKSDIRRALFLGPLRCSGKQKTSDFPDTLPFLTASD
jgi:hypothetical protein